MHTNSPLPEFLRHDPKDRNNFNHDFHDDARHSHRRSDFYICLKSLEKEFHATKQLDKNILGSADVLDGLKDT
jgi:hypothetical protein